MSKKNNLGPRNFWKLLIRGVLFALLVISATLLAFYTTIKTSHIYILTVFGAFGLSFTTEILIWRMEVLIIKSTKLHMQKKRNNANLPKKALKLIYFFLPKNTSEFLVGDICEDFPKQVERMGPRGAKAWVWKECVFAIGNAALDWGISKFRALGGILRIGGGG